MKKSELIRILAAFDSTSNIATSLWRIAFNNTVKGVNELRLFLNTELRDFKDNQDISGKELLILLNILNEREKVVSSRSSWGQPDKFINQIFREIYEQLYRDLTTEKLTVDLNMTSVRQSIIQATWDRVSSLAAAKIQSVFRGKKERKRTNIYGKSQGKEIEIYLPLGSRTYNSETNDFEMPGNYKEVICTSDLFSIQVDYMNFCKKIRDFGIRSKLKIPEIVTAPFRQEGEANSNLPIEYEIDSAVTDFLLLIEKFAYEASTHNPDEQSYYSLTDLMQHYNEKHPRHPLSLDPSLKEYLNNPQYKSFDGSMVFVPEHQNLDICLMYDRKLFPVFDTTATPRTTDARDIIDKNDYQVGKLLIHVQKTFSLSVEMYRAEFISTLLNNTAQQLEFLQEAQRRAETFITHNSLPVGANRERILGLLIIAAEQVIIAQNAAKYQHLHESADRAVLSMRHILHYVKLNICNQIERNWFDNMFKEHYADIQKLLCIDRYTPAYRGDDGSYGHIGSVNSLFRYDVIFDLFGGFHLAQNMNIPSTSLDKMGITSWSSLFSNYASLSGRTLLKLQKTYNEQDHSVEFHPLFEARRIGLMTIKEYQEGQSQIPLLKPVVIMTEKLGEEAIRHSI